MKNSRVSSSLQNLVNAQSSVNRVVHEANKLFEKKSSDRTPDPEYMQDCIADAQAELVAAVKWLRGRRPAR